MKAEESAGSERRDEDMGNISYDGGRDGLKERRLDQGDRRWGDERE